MTENKTLLSQNEIDALIFFLERHEDTKIGNVLDQKSIDKLVDIVKSYNSEGIILKKDVVLDITEGREFARVIDKDGQCVTLSDCEIMIDVGSDKFISVICKDTVKNETYPLYPECLTKKSYVKEGSSWGFAVAPSTLLKLSKLFDLKCSEKTLKEAGKIFAKVVYGDESRVIPGYYAG